MQPYPHYYAADASGQESGSVMVSAAGVETLPTAPPAQFDGPGDQWSPETLLVAAAADCFVLTFRAIARASKLEWAALRCNAEGELNRVDGTTRFTHLNLRVYLTIVSGTDAEKARRLVEKSEKACLITSSLALTPTLTCEIHTAPNYQLASGSA